MFQIDRTWCKKQLIDQSSHMIAAMVLLSPLLLFPAWWTALIAGLGYGIVREITEEGSPVTLAKVKIALYSFNSLLDISFWGIGGMLAWFLFS